jgi:hypothetical protein
MTEHDDEKKPKKVTIVLDDEKLVLPDRDTTPNSILRLADLDPSTHYLVEIKGRHQVSYQGKGDEQIRVNDGDTFISLSTGPTPTS